jgi:hypothetical protein
MSYLKKYSHKDDIIPWMSKAIKDSEVPINGARLYVGTSLIKCMAVDKSFAMHFIAYPGQDLDDLGDIGLGALGTYRDMEIVVSRNLHPMSLCVEEVCVRAV